MMLIEETTVPLTALPVTELRAHLRLGSGFAEDSLQDAVLESFLRAAFAAIEARTGKALITRDFMLTLNAWRDDAGQVLSIAPVQSIASVTLVDRFGASAPVPVDRWRLERDMHAPRLMPRGACLPAIGSGGAVEIRFAAGFAADWGGLPADLGQAVLLLAAHYYEYRDETALGRGCMPFGATSLIERYRALRLGLGT